MAWGWKNISSDRPLRADELLKEYGVMEECVLPALATPAQQRCYQRLFYLSHGVGRDFAPAVIEEVGRALHVSERTTRRALDSLDELEFVTGIERVSRAPSLYRVRLPSECANSLPGKQEGRDRDVSRAFSEALAWLHEMLDNDDYLVCQAMVQAKRKEMKADVYSELKEMNMLDPHHEKVKLAGLIVDELGPNRGKQYWPLFQHLE